MMEESPGEEVSHVLPNHATGQMFSIPPPIIYTYGRLGMGYSETQRMVKTLLSRYECTTCTLADLTLP